MELTFITKELRYLENMYREIGDLLGYPRHRPRIQLTMKTLDTNDVIVVASAGLDAKGAPTPLAGALTATVDDTTHFAVAPDASAATNFRVTRLPNAAGDTAGVLTPTVTVTDTNGVSGSFNFESDPSAETAIGLTGVVVPAGAPLSSATVTVTPSATPSGS